MLYCFSFCTFTDMKATHLREIHRYFGQQPVEIDQLGDWYVDARKARGENPRGRIQRLLEDNGDNHQHILLVGYRGCGKSTELNHLRNDLKESYLTIRFSVMEELDAVSLNYIELFIVAMEKLFEVAKEHQFSISKEYLKSITEWVATKEIVEIRDKYMGGGLEIGGSGEIKAGNEQGILETPFLLKFFSGLKLSAKTSKSFKETLTKNIEPRLSELVTHCNDLIREVLIDAHTKGFQNLLIIIEDLDKIPLDVADNLFYTYSNQLTQLETNIIYTFPVALYYHTRFNTIRHHFTTIHELPMIKVIEKNADPYEPGIEVIRKMVDRRMEMSLWESPAILDEMVKYSGGCLRDLFLMIKEAADTALDAERTVIRQSDFDRALQVLKREYDNNIADNRKADGELIAADAYYEVLIQLANSTDKKLKNTEAAMDLRQNLCILGYNGEGWCDVHPVMKEVLRDRGLLEK